MSGKGSVGRSLTLLVLFVVTIVVILVIFAYFTGLITFTGGSSDSAHVAGVFALDPNNSTAATLIVSVSNTGSDSITGIGFSCPTTDFASATCKGLTVTNIDGTIGTENPIKSNSAAGGSALLELNPSANLSGGVSVTVTVVVTFADGTVATYPLLLPAQV